MNTIATEVGNFKRGQASNTAMDAFFDDAGSIDVCVGVGGANDKQINAGDGVDELSTNAGKPQCDCTLDESSDYTSL